MIGIFDSGDGGLAALKRLRGIAPNADIIFYADRKNAPYGNKTQKELIRLVKRDIIKLKEAGASSVLMACCTASTVFHLLPHQLTENTYQILTPTAEEALRVTKNGRIAVIATNATVSSHAFKSELLRLGAEDVKELEAQELVGLTEGGGRDASLTDVQFRRIYELLSNVKACGADTLILGCTHFSHLKNKISSALPKMRIVDSAAEGAKEIARHAVCGKGRTVILPP